MESVQSILKQAAEEQASDLFIIAGKGISMKKEGVILPVQDNRLMPEDAEQLVRELYTLAGRSIDHYLESGDDDFSVSVVGTARFRVNTYRQRGSMAAVIRVVSFGIPNWKTNIGGHEGGRAEPGPGACNRPRWGRQVHHPGLRGGRHQPEPERPHHHH